MENRMGRTKGSPNKQIPLLPSASLSAEQRINLLANLLLETILFKHDQEQKISKEITEQIDV